MVMLGENMLYVNELHYISLYLYGRVNLAPCLCCCSWIVSLALSGVVSECLSAL